MRMSDGQRKTLVDAFLLVAAAARQGKMKAETATAEEVRSHVDKLEEMVREIRRGLDGHIGATAVLDRVGLRAKPLSSSRPR